MIKKWLKPLKVTKCAQKSDFSHCIFGNPDECHVSPKDSPIFQAKATWCHMMPHDATWCRMMPHASKQSGDILPLANIWGCTLYEVLPATNPGRWAVSVHALAKQTLMVTTCNSQRARQDSESSAHLLRRRHFDMSQGLLVAVDSLQSPLFSMLPLAITAKRNIVGHHSKDLCTIQSR